VEGSKTFLLVGTLDRKGAEYAYLRERLRGHGVDTILADAGGEEPRGAEPSTAAEGAFEPSVKSITRPAHSPAEPSHCGPAGGRPWASAGDAWARAPATTITTHPTTFRRISSLLPTSFRPALLP
jgi:Uncharacterised protein family (UPF0261)